jgi:hypothetical protein
VTEQLLAEIARGQGLSMAMAAGRFPPSRSGRPVHPATASRWALRGVKTRDGRLVRLEAARVGGRWVTTEPAIRRFIGALQPHETATPPPAGTDRHEVVEQELAKLGVG